MLTLDPKGFDPLFLLFWLLAWPAVSLLMLWSIGRVWVRTRDRLKAQFVVAESARKALILEKAELIVELADVRDLKDDIFAQLVRRSDELTTLRADVLQAQQRALQTQQPSKPPQAPGAVPSVPQPKITQYLEID